MARSFSALHWSGQVPDIHPGTGILFYTNHPSWWDPATFSVLQERFFPERTAFGPIDAPTLARYPFLGRAGFLPVAHDSPASIRRLLAAASHILGAGGVFWITAQGEFTDAQMRPVRLRPGLAHIARHSPGCVAIPVALDYRFTTESRPEAFIRFGTPHDPQEQDADRASLQIMLERCLERTMDELASDITFRRAVFAPVFNGSSGMGGLYARIQRLAALIRKRQYEPRHRSQ